MTGAAAAVVAGALSTALIAPPAPPMQSVVADAFPHVLVLPHPRVPALATMDSDWRMASLEGKPVQAHPTMPVLSAYGFDHRVDAHLTCYTIETTEGLATTPIPRLTKQLVAGLDRMRDEERELIAKGGLAAERAVFAHIRGVVGTMLALDFDLPDHVRWTDAHREQVERLLGEAAQRNPLLAAPSVFYTTSGGFRLVWLLAQPIDVLGAGGLEDRLYGLVAHAHIAGLTVDTACKDWTRLFRLPRVVRADKPPAEAQTWLQPYYAQSWGRVDFTAREALPPNGHVAVHSVSAFQPLSAMSIEQFQTNVKSREIGEKWKLRVGRPPRDVRDTYQSIALGEQPDDGSVQQLLAGGGTHSAAYKQAMSRLRAMGYPREKERIVPEAKLAYEILVEGADICTIENGQRQLHQGISRLSRALCYAFRDRLGERAIDVTPQFIHALVVQPARKANASRASEGDGKVRSEAEIDAEVWRLVKWFYQHFRGSAIIAAEEAEEIAQERADIQLKLIAQVGAHQEAIVRSLMEWSGAYSDANVSDWIRSNWQRLLLLKHSSGRSVLQFAPSGQVCYSLPAEAWGDILSLGRDSGHDLIRWQEQTKQGDDRLRKAEEVYFECSRVTDDTVLSRLVPTSRVKITRGSDDMIVNFVQALPGMRTDIEPKYDPQVDEWLHLLAGETPDEFFDWLAAFPRIERPSTALYLQGAAGIGKGMLGQALKNMTVRRMAAPFDQAVQEFQDTMTKTPFIWADEKVTTKRMTKALMDSFKKLVSGEADTLNRKGKEHVTIEGHWRVLITANHADALPWDQEVSGHDLDAIISRLNWVKASSDLALKFLDQIGQRDGTADWPEKAIPRHLMHIAQTRAVDTTKRFLVQSQVKQYHLDMQARTSGTDEILRLLGRMLRTPEKFPTCLFILENHVYFNVPNGFEIMTKLAAQDGRRGSFIDHERALSRSIKNNSLDEAPANHRVQLANKVTNVLKLWRLDMKHIISWLNQHDQDVDLRRALGPIIWKRDAPPEVQETLDRLMPLKDWEKTGARKAPPPPPPSKDRVVPFPTTGLQAFK